MNACTGSEKFEEFLLFFFGPESKIECLKRSSETKEPKQSRARERRGQKVAKMRNKFSEQKTESEVVEGEAEKIRKLN